MIISEAAEIRPHPSTGHIMPLHRKESGTLPMREFINVLECWDNVRNGN